jgi:hypothetical protein
MVSFDTNVLVYAIASISGVRVIDATEKCAGPFARTFIVPLTRDLCLDRNARAEGVASSSSSPGRSVCESGGSKKA